MFPVEEATFALYLQHIEESTQSRAAVEEGVNAVSWLHLLSGLTPINESSFVRAMMEGLKRMLAKPKIKKEPVTVGMLSAMADIHLVASLLSLF